MYNYDEEIQLALSNCKKCVEWICKNFPHAVKTSFSHEIVVQLHHDTYTNLRLEIEDGRFIYVHGSWGSNCNSEYYNLETGRVYDVKGREIDRIGKCYVDFIHDWPIDKSYIISTLQKYEDDYNFEP